MHASVSGWGTFEAIDFANAMNITPVVTLFAGMSGESGHLGSLCRTSALHVGRSGGWGRAGGRLQFFFVLTYAQNIDGFMGFSKVQIQSSNATWNPKPTVI